MSKPAFPPVMSETVRLRLLEERDLEMTLGWRNQENIRKWFLTNSPLSFNHHHAWFLKYQALNDDFVFVIESLPHGGLPVGQIALYRVDREERRAEYGRLMIGNPIALRQGIAREATRLVLRFAFETLSLREVVLFVLLENDAARRLYESVGFRPDGQDERTLKMRIDNPARMRGEIS